MYTEYWAAEKLLINKTTRTLSYSTNTVIFYHMLSTRLTTFLRRSWTVKRGYVLVCGCRGRQSMYTQRAGRGPVNSGTGIVNEIPGEGCPAKLQRLFVSHGYL